MIQIDFSKLMDLRVDYAFKLLFIKGEPRLLVSLLNAVFTNAMELHYINMKAFAKAVNETNSIAILGEEETMFAKWLAVITQEEIKNKDLIKKACEEEELNMAVQTMKRHLDDMVTRYSYEKRQEEVAYFNARMNDLKVAVEETANAKRETANAKRETANAKRETANIKRENEILQRKLEELMAQLSSNEE